MTDPPQSVGPLSNPIPINIPMRVTIGESQHTYRTSIIATLLKIITLLNIQAKPILK